MLHYLPHIIVALLVLGSFVLVWRREGDDPIWQARWRGLSSEDRSRIEAAARSGSLLPSQDEIELAAGFARRDRRRGLPGRLIAALDIPVGVVLIGGGVLSGVVVFIAFGAFFVLLGLYRLGRARRIARGLRETISRDQPPIG